MISSTSVLFSLKLSHVFTLISNLDMVQIPWNSIKLASLIWVIYSWFWAMGSPLYVIWTRSKTCEIFQKLISVISVLFSMTLSHLFTLISNLDMVQSPWNSSKLVSVIWAILFMNLRYGFKFLPHLDTVECLLNSTKLIRVIWVLFSMKLSHAFTLISNLDMDQILWNSRKLASLILFMILSHGFTLIPHMDVVENAWNL